MGGMHLQAREHPGPPAAGGEAGNPSLPRAFRGSVVLPTPALQTSASQKWDPQCMLFPAPQLVVLFMAALGKKTDSCIQLDRPDDLGVSSPEASGCSHALWQFQGARPRSACPKLPRHGPPRFCVLSRKEIFVFPIVYNSSVGIWPKATPWYS